MRITYHQAKRDLTLAERGLDFADAPLLFAGDSITVVDDRWNYGELRLQTVGWLDGAVVIVIWTPRAEARHIISMRRCNSRERRDFQLDLDRSGRRS